MKIFMSAALLFLLGGGIGWSKPAYKLVVDMFIHYLVGGGTTLTVSIGINPCPVAGEQSTYGSDLQNALGYYHCPSANTLGEDLYDFSYAGNGKCRFLRRARPTWTWQDLPFYWQYLQKSAASDIGRCIVQRPGVGQVYKVIITK
jgi:hypothetical protein